MGPGAERGRSLPQAAQRWRPLRTLPAGLAGYLVALAAVAVGFGVLGLETTPIQPTDLSTWAALTGAALLCLEVARRGGQPAGPSKDLLSVWKIPILLVLPPVWSLLTPLPLIAFQQMRVRRGLLHRRVVSAAVIGVADWTGSVLFHGLMPAGSTLGAWLLRSPTPALGAALLAALLSSALNAVLIATAARLASPEMRWRGWLCDRDNLALDLGEVSAGVLVAAAFAWTPLALLIALPPVLLLQRSGTCAQLRIAARTDGKTGLLNAGAWQEEAEREIVRASRERRPLAILFADVDHFKQVNDIHGHLVGDRVLVVVADALRAGLRPYDLAGRFGGEEFTVLLPNTGHAEATRIAERLRRRVAAALLALDDEMTVQVTISVGGSVLGTHGKDLTDLLTAADLGLYRAKRSGRNRVSIAAG